MNYISTCTNTGKCAVDSSNGSLNISSGDVFCNTYYVSSVMSGEMF